jgi:hypothetical protein
VVCLFVSLSVFGCETALVDVNSCTYTVDTTKCPIRDTADISMAIGVNEKKSVRYDQKEEGFSILHAQADDKRRPMETTR